MKHTVKIDKETFELAFTMGALDLIEQAIPEFNMSTVSKYTKRSGAMIDILYAMAQQGELLAGRELRHDREWFGAHIPAAPKKIAEIQIAVFDTISDAIKMENNTDGDGTVDEVLEEIKKNKAADA